MKTRYLYSACVSIKTEDCTILCDPWFHQAYEGAWAQWPRIENPLGACGPADLVYISHVHPDHYDPRFLSEYLAKYSQAKVIIANQNPALLERKLRSRGIEPIVGPLTVGKTVLTLIPNRSNRGLNIDSALVVSDGKNSVVNLNDNAYDQGQIDLLLGCCPDGHPTVALLPFVGAGPWPQCYEFDSPEEQLKAAEAKKVKGLALFKKYCDALQPDVAVPFAGQYWLHGPQLDLNPLRGMADATECSDIWKRVWVPADGGQATLTMRDSGFPNRILELLGSANREEPYDWPTVRQKLQEHDDLYHRRAFDRHVIQYPFYRYEREIEVTVERLPLLKLLQSAIDNAYPMFKDGPLLHIYIKTQLPQWFHLITTSRQVFENNGPEETPRYEVHIDARYLFGVLTRLYNGNSARIGSLCRFKVVPMEPFDEKLYDLFGDYWDSLRV